MFCPHCGNSVPDGSSFCAACGAFVAPYAAPGPMYAPKAAKKSNSAKYLAVAVVLILVLAAVTTVFAFSYSLDREEPTYTIYLDNGDKFVLSGAFLPGQETLSVGVLSDEMEFVLDPEKAAEYTFYEWKLFDLDHNVYTDTLGTKYSGMTPVRKAEPALHYFLNNSDGTTSAPGAGWFQVSLKCYSGSDTYNAVKTYEGKVKYFTTVEKSYSWIYENKAYEMDVIFDYQAYDDARNKNKNGRWPSSSAYSSFIEYNDPVVVDMAEKLTILYGPHSNTDPGFANFVLAFDQICIKYPPNSNNMDADKYMFGTNEYFQYPIETIYNGAGDCEDTSILAAAIYAAAGYESAILVLPGHAMTAVVVDADYSPSTTMAYEYLKGVKNGKTYAAGETTVESFMELGLSQRNAHEGNPYSFYLQKENNNNGLYAFYPAK
ncbi:MAG: zinc ribbon domain-containing protein [Candidatus Methanoplasma sp.]|jgi:hypothetical protein|nr:zinc ribbon domain-containing protein [Candidatus Methanoplasma sp.]